jgi:hypothetical protein
MPPKEARTWSPLWLEYSGLPQFLTEKTRGGPAWLFFKKIVELDCERNSAPGTIELSLQELELRTGISPEKARRAAPVLRKLKLLAFFLPDNDEEAALFRVVTPLPTPRTPAEIRTSLPHLFEQGGQYFRYVDDCVAASEDELPASDPDLKAVVDLYFDVVGLKMNVFILDELRMLPQKFSMHEIRGAFARARKNEIHSLRWVIQELVRRHKKTEDAPKPAENAMFAGNHDDSIKF